jgi:hypothetical protein
MHGLHRGAALQEQANGTYERDRHPHKSSSHPSVTGMILERRPVDLIAESTAGNESSLPWPRSSNSTAIH